MFYKRHLYINVYVSICKIEFFKEYEINKIVFKSITYKSVYYFNNKTYFRKTNDMFYSSRY